jgi:hypothetical protein
MLQFAQDIGTIKKGVANLEKGQGEVNQKVSGLHATVANLVTREECVGRHEDLEEVPGGLLERLGKKAGSLMTIIALVAALGGGLLMFARFLSKVETSLDVSAEQQRKAFLKLSEPPKPVIVHQPVYIYPDAGPPDRRRPRRPR